MTPVTGAAIVGGLAAMLMASLVYLNALPNPFIYDDHHTVVANPSLRSGNLRAILLYDRTRPIVNLTYAWDQLLWHGRAFGFRLTNLLLHVANVGLLYRLAWRLAADRQSAARGALPLASRPSVSAFAVAALFAVHPMLSESVGYVSARHEILCATFFLLAMLAGRRWVHGGGWRWGSATVGLWLVAMATKEVGAMLPFVLLAYDWLWGRADHWRHRLLGIHGPLIALAIGLGIGRLAFLTWVEFPGQARVHWELTWLALDVLQRYVALLLVPIGQTAFHAVRPIASIWDVRAIGALATIGVVLSLAWKLRRSPWLGSLGSIWFLLLLVPGAVLTLFNQGEPMTEHRVYLASCGFFLAVGDGLAWLDAALRQVARSAHGIGRLGFAIVLLMAASLTVTRNRIWAHPVALWGEAVDFAPQHPRPRVLLGEALEDAGRLDEATAEYRTAIGLQPDSLDGHLKLGHLLVRTGRTQEAREHFTAALRAHPDDPSARRSMAMLDELAASQASDGVGR